MFELLLIIYLLPVLIIGMLFLKLVFWLLGLPYVLQSGWSRKLSSLYGSLSYLSLL